MQGQDALLLAGMASTLPFSLRRFLGVLGVSALAFNSIVERCVSPTPRETRPTSPDANSDTAAAAFSSARPIGDQAFGIAHLHSSAGAG